MKAEELIEQVTSTCPWISREQIANRLEKERLKTNGLISDETLLKMIAAEFGCDTPKDTLMPSLLLKDLIPGLNDVTVEGRIIAVFPPKVFGKDKEGRLASFLIADRSDILRVVLWNDKASSAESYGIKTGQIARFSHGYTRQNSDGKVELHINERSEVQIDPLDLKEMNYPGVAKFSLKIGKLTENPGNARINVVGRVKMILPAKTFAREDSTQGKVMRFVLEDCSGEIPVVVWNERANELEKTLKVGVELQVVNARVKKALDRGLEINADGSTCVEPLHKVEEFVDIADLKEEMDHVNVEGAVASKPIVRNVKTVKDEILELATFELKDQSGKIWVSAWRNHASAAGHLKPGDNIIIKNAYAKKGFGEHLELSTRNNTVIIVSQ